jgi:hypothetical protein
MKKIAKEGNNRKPNNFFQLVDVFSNERNNRKEMDDFRKDWKNIKREDSLWKCQMYQKIDILSNLS